MRELSFSHRAVLLLAYFLGGVAASLALLSWLVGCAPEKPACSSLSLAAIETAYVDEAVRACADAGSREACAEMPAIEKKYESKREEWVRCH